MHFEGRWEMGEKEPFTRSGLEAYVCHSRKKFPVFDGRAAGARGVYRPLLCLLNHRRVKGCA